MYQFKKNTYNPGATYLALIQLFIKFDRKMWDGHKAYRSDITSDGKKSFENSGILKGSIYSSNMTMRATTADVGPS